MKIFIDTANLDQINQANEWGILDGVTTNPSLMAKEGIKGSDKIYEHYLDICELVSGDVSAEVVSTDLEGMIAEAEILSALHRQIVVKIPMTEAGVKSIATLKEKNIRTNCTLIFSIGQALLAAKAGAHYISPFIGRLDDLSVNGLHFVRDIIDILDSYDFGTQVLAASVRHPLHIAECAKMGADVVTAPLGVIKSLVRHPLTDKGLDQFLSDHKKANGC